MSDVPPQQTVDYASPGADLPKRWGPFLWLGAISLSLPILQIPWLVLVGWAAWNGWLGDPTVRSKSEWGLLVVFAPSILAIITGIPASLGRARYRLQRVFGILGLLGGIAWWIWFASGTLLKRQ